MVRIPSLRPIGWLLLSGILVLSAGRMHGQSYQIGPLRTGGTIRLSTQAYSASGINGRRPPLMGEVAGNVTFNLLGLRTGLNLLYSTDQSRFRQSMSRLAFGTSWRWGSLALGDVSPSLSSYSLNGATVRGGFVELYPGIVQLSFAGGRAQRSVSPSVRSALLESPYERWLWAVRVGLGKPDRTHVHLIGLLGRDHPGPAADTLGAPLAVENLTLTPTFGLVLFDEKVALFGEVSASAFTRDTRSEPLDVSGSGVPSGATDVFQPRASTRVDFAAEGRLEIDLDVAGLDVDYRRVMPTFESLGLGLIRRDEERIRLRPRVALFAKRLSVGFDLAQTRNNLLGQRTATLWRRQIGATVQARVSPSVMLTGAVQRMSNENRPASSDPAYASLTQRQVAQTVMLAPTFMLRAGAIMHTISLNGTLQTFSDQRPRSMSGPSADFTNVNSSLTYALAFPSGLTVGLSGTALRSKAATMTTDSFGLQTHAGASLMKRLLSLTISGGVSSTSSTSDVLATISSRQLVGSLGASYRVTPADVVRLSVRGLSSQATGGYAAPFREVQTQLRYEHRF